jgi:hypothetical protein
VADLAENLRSVVIASTAIAAEFTGIAAPYAVIQGWEPQEDTLPRMHFARSSFSEEVDLNAEGGLTEQQFDLEVISDDLDEAQDIAHATRKFLNGKRGTFGTQTVQGVFVEDHNDDYIPKGVASEEAYHVAALAVTIWHAST